MTDEELERAGQLCILIYLLLKNPEPFFKIVNEYEIVKRREKKEIK